MGRAINWRRVARVAAVPLALTGITSASALAERPARGFQDRLLAQVETRARVELGRAYGCLATRPDKPARLLVTSRAALPDAADVIRQFDAKDLIQTGVVARRYSHRAIQRVLSAVRANLSDLTGFDQSGADVRLVATPSQPCKIVQLTIVSSNDALQDLARETQARYGADRLSVKRVPAGSVFPR